MGGATLTAGSDTTAYELPLSWTVTPPTAPTVQPAPTGGSDLLDLIELCAGPGGFSQGYREVFPHANSVGVELDQAACDTARAAGHTRLLADVALLDPTDYLARYFHGSMPCQGFSIAGKGKGREDADRLIAAIRFSHDQREYIDRVIASFHGNAHDPRSALTLQPLRWVAAGMPQFVSLEQVPAVLPIWEAYAETMRAWGYQVWTGIMSAEQFGTPQVRKRSILLARLGPVPVFEPAPTHSKFHNRTPSRLDPGVASWVTMAEALGWGMTARPYPTVAAGTAAGGTDPSMIGGSGARKIIFGEREAGRWVEQPANHVLARMDPAYRAAVAAVVGPRVNNQSGTNFDLAWPADRPAPTIAGRDIVTMPGANANRFNGATKSRNDGVRITAAEGGVLQGFPVDYPWSGNKGDQHQQVGNAVPPPLAAAMVSHLTAGHLSPLLATANTAPLAP